MICAGRKHMIYWDLNCFSNLEFSFIHACYTFFPKAPKMVFAGVCFIEIFFVKFFHFFFCYNYLIFHISWKVPSISQIPTKFSCCWYCFVSNFLKFSIFGSLKTPLLLYLIGIQEYVFWHWLCYLQGHQSIKRHFLKTNWHSDYLSVSFHVLL